MKAQSEGKKSVKMETKDLKKDLDKVSKGKTPAKTKPEATKTTIQTEKMEAGAEDDKKAFYTPEVKKERKEEQKEVVLMDAGDDSVLERSPKKEVKKEKKSNVLLERFENICSE